MQAVWNYKAQYDQFTGEDVFDCMLAESILAQGRTPVTQEDAFKKYQVTSLLQLCEVQTDLLKKDPASYSLYSDIERPLIDVLHAMENHGITVDPVILEKTGKQIEAEIATVTQEIDRESGQPVNLASPTQVGDMLVNTFNIPLPKTATGKYATGEGELSKLVTFYPITAKILQHRNLSKLKSTYIDPLIQKIGSDGKIHTTYNQVNVITGRLSSSNPNLQNIPATGPFSKEIKSAFKPAPGRTFIAFDYSQQELRILAHLSGEDTLKQAFQEKKDIHRLTAAQLFDVAYDQVSDQQRNIAKTINFGIVYGMGSFGLSQTLAIPQDQAAKFIQTFYATYPKIKIFFDKLLANAKTQDCVQTILGRKRYVFRPGANRSFIDNATRRELINFPIQGSAADLMKLAMIRIYTEVVKKIEQVNMILQIHDELIFEIGGDSGQQEEITNRIMKIMNTVYPLDVPMEVEMSSGQSWGSLTPIS